MKVVHNCNLSQYNAYGIPAYCDTAYFPDTPDDISVLMQGPLNEKPYILLGSGHNVILAEPSYETPFVIFHGNMCQTHISDQRQLTAGAGAFTKDICRLALSHGLSGLEVFYDIPSSIGGSIVMNAGAYDEDISGILKDVTFWDQLEDNIVTLPRDALNLAYRNSMFQEDNTKIILEATFILSPGNKTDIAEKMYSIRSRRWEKQPREYPNAGSVFKRPQGRYVGPMLDELGLKGYEKHGFRVSPKHSGFIEKVGAGNGADLLHLIDDIREKVVNKFDVHLELEQRVIRSE